MAVEVGAVEVVDVVKVVEVLLAVLVDVDVELVDMDVELVEVADVVTTDVTLPPSLCASTNVTS
jgi:hypothetical protein